MSPTPDIRLHEPPDYEPTYGEAVRATCLQCGYVGPLDSFDVLGADDGNMFCPRCGEEGECPFVKSEG